MPRPTIEELNLELTGLVTQHNAAIEEQTKCKTRIIQIQAILNDRASEAELTEEATVES